MNEKPSQPSSEVKFEIGHVLFIDIVGYSKLNIHEQSAQIQKLKEIVRGTEQVRAAEAEGKLLLLPTGDGGALVFRTNPEAPVLCAIEIAKELKKHRELPVRMGIHSGPVNEIKDLNEQANIAGAATNMAQRVVDCGADAFAIASGLPIRYSARAGVGAIGALSRRPEGEKCRSQSASENGHRAFRGDLQDVVTNKSLCYKEIAPL